MAESQVQVTSGAGPKLHTWQRTITGPGTVEDEFVLPGEYPMPTYIFVANSVSIATINDHVAQLMAGASLNVRIRRITVGQAVVATTAVSGRIDVLRLTTAGTGGTVVTNRPHDSADAAAGATGMTLPTAKGTEGVTLLTRRMQLVQTAPVGGGFAPYWEWVQEANSKPLIIPAGAANGICLKNAGTVAGATVDVTIEFVETAFL